MYSESQTKINYLLKVWPPGTVAALPWLREQGVSQQLADQYVRSGWLRRLGHGAFVRAEDEPEWTGGLYALQRHLALPIHAGAGTALGLNGFAHYLPMYAQTEVVLFGPPKTQIPTWFRNYDWGARVAFSATRLFQSGAANTLVEKSFGGYSTRAHGHGVYGGGAFAIWISTPERAMFEVCARVPLKQSYDDARSLMEGLVSLRPSHIQLLLELCTSIKTKRLFMHLAEICNHQWVGKLSLANVDFGSGKRMLVKGGRLDTKYQITVPAEDLT